MLRPADIEARDFLVVVHGYHKGEVREFLSEIGRAYAELVEKVEQGGGADGQDDFESMGSEIAGVLRAAKEAAAAMTAEAERTLREATEEAATARADAERAAEELLGAAESMRAEAERTAAELRAQGEAALADAREAAHRIEREADERARAHQIEAEAGVRTRLDALHGHEAAIRARIEELGDAVRDAVGSLDGATGSEHLDLASASYQ